MKSHKHTLNCNICTAPNCPLNHKQMQNATDTTQCGYFRHPVPFKVPILVHLASDENKIGAVRDLLSEHGFQIQEKLTYPYFKLVMKG